MFLPDELSYQDVQTTAFSLNCCLCLRVAVLGREMQSAREPRFLPLGKKCHRVEREGERAYVMFTKWDVIWGLGRVNLGATSQWPQTSSTSFGRMGPPLSVGNQPVGQNTNFMGATTQTASPAKSGVELTRPITPLDRIEEEDQYILVITASIRKLSLGESASVDLRESVTALPGRGAFQNPHMATVFSEPARRVISGQGTMVEELEE